MRGLAALLPTLITLSLLVWVWNFLWNNLGDNLIQVLKAVWAGLVQAGVMEQEPNGYIGRYWNADLMRTRVVGVGLAVLLVYIVGVFVGNLIGRTAWRMAERAVLRIPLVRAIYPAVKQVTDFVLAERAGQFHGSRVVAIEPHARGIWSIGLVTGTGHWPTGAGGEKVEMVTVFVPSSPTAISGYVLVVPRSTVVELPMTVEEAMRLLVSGGVIGPQTEVLEAAAQAQPARMAPGAPESTPGESVASEVELRLRGPENGPITTGG
jgi:uncharacterized membrane protein